MFEHLPWKVENSIDRFFRTGEPEMEIVGSDSATLLAGLLTLPKVALNEKPHLVVTADMTAAQKLETSLRFIAPENRVHLLPSFDVGVYSGLYPNRRTLAARMRWLWQAQNAKPGDIFVAPVESLLQRTLPYQSLSQRALRLRKNDVLPENFATLLEARGYANVPLVEDVGTFSIRGGIVDVFSPAHDHPIRLELFGDIVESLREFDEDNQRSLGERERLEIIPAQEILFTDENRQNAATRFKASYENRPVDREEAQALLHQLVQGQHFHGIEFLLSLFYDTPVTPIDHFNSPLNLWRLDPFELTRAFDQLVAAAKKEFEASESQIIRPLFSEVYAPLDSLEPPPESQTVTLSKVRLGDEDSEKGLALLPISTSDLKEIASTAKSLATQAGDLADFLGKKIREWKNLGYRVFVSVTTQAQAQRLKLLLEKSELQPRLIEENLFGWEDWLSEQEREPNLIHVIERPLGESLRYSDEHLILLREEDLFGAKRARAAYKSSGTLEQRAHAFNFGDIKPGDLIVHKLHGIGTYEGLKVMPIQGIAAEFIQIKYKDNDRLYLPVYRVHQIQKYSGPSAGTVVDKLGGPGWEKTKTKVRSHLRDVAAELLKIYAERSVAERPPFSTPDQDFTSFEATFPYQETDDQLRAIADVLRDMQKVHPMDRLVCGDVGFGKTEVAMRAAFHAVHNKRQVAIIAPTTVLSFQHLENFKKRFAKWAIDVRGLNRFVAKKDMTATLKDLKEGKVDIVIGTHRLLSSDVQFKNLGLLIIDEEQRFGVKHKEKLRKLKSGLDTLAMSATPIPRTLNMSLVGIRDLSLINTAPVDRLATRTFVTKYEAETIRKAITSEVARGGQVYFIHNRVQSIYQLADQLREIVPDVRFRVAHGQMEEGELEKCMIEFFNHEIDMLVCTTIVESGMDVSAANTMFIDNAQQLGLSQLYQLRGRVGRSKERAYCYLLIPNHRRIEKDAQERLRIIQENTALGSGIRIAQYDLELRGAGDILGEEQAGHVNAVGYELYLELLEEAVRGAKGEEVDIGVEPEINVRIPALIPDSYISDLRIRLAYYKQLSEIESPEDIDRIEDELRDQFGKLPDQVLNLMGLMLIRKVCKDLAVRDLSSGESTITLAFTEKTPLPVPRVIELASRTNKKYSITPDNRLRVRMNEITWPRIHDELMYLKSLC
ncbi:MAG: transcription-repair coupling factor [Bdellovibrionales bacterium]|nr:transcription-repair coupling factor [Bdellovibrionales bacterium]